MVTWTPVAAAGVAALSLIAALVFSRLVLKADAGSEHMKEISSSIRDGVFAFVRREYSYIAVFAVILVILISVALRNEHGWMIAMCYILGTACSLAAGFAGLAISTRANSRTTQAATGGLAGALDVAFRSGAVMGLTVAGLGLLGLTGCYIIFESILGFRDSSNIILGFALGASTVALFARVGGGIFTKGADIGADMAGKAEEGIPEDDARNPAVITDLVGDNVGDVAGMGADLNESYIAAIVAPIAIGASGVVYQKLGVKAMVLPLAIAGAGVACSILGSLFVRAGNSKRSAQSALTLTMYATSALAMLASFWLVWGIAGRKNIGLFWALLAGVLSGIVIGLTSEYFTSDHFRPVKEVAKSAQKGAGTTILTGLATGMISTVVPVAAVAIAIGVAFVTGNHVIHNGGGVYAIGLAALGMLCTTGILVAIDAYSPVADNAAGIAQMAEVDEETKQIVESLDSVGTTTATVGRGFAIGSAALAALALFAAYAHATGLSKVDMIGNYRFFVGLLLGVVTPFVFSALTLSAVGRTASALIDEVRRQFQDIAGLREGEPGAKPDYKIISDMTTRTALFEMLIPALIAVVAPLLIGGFLGVESLAGFLGGALACGFVMAVFMTNAGGAWDNAKKFIESGELGGKGTPTHDASICGDTVGDPFKDTSGPAMNILIKVMAVVSLLFVPLFLK